MSSDQTVVEEFVAVEDPEGEFSETKLIRTQKAATPKAKRTRVSVFFWRPLQIWNLKVFFGIILMVYLNLAVLFRYYFDVFFEIGKFEGAFSVLFEP